MCLTSLFSEKLLKSSKYIVLQIYFSEKKVWRSNQVLWKFQGNVSLLSNIIKRYVNNFAIVRSSHLSINGAADGNSVTALLWIRRDHSIDVLENI